MNAITANIAEVDSNNNNVVTVEKVTGNPVTKQEDYLIRFFDEKQVENNLYMIGEFVDQHEILNIVELTASMVIDILVNQASPAEKAGAADIIRQIDFHNGDIHHFLNHLAEGYLVSKGIERVL